MQLDLLQLVEKSLWLCLVCFAIRLGIQFVCRKAPSDRPPVPVEEPSPSHTSSPVNENLGQASEHQVYILALISMLCALQHRQLKDIAHTNSSAIVFLASLPHTSIH